jgi:hypothetical protein
MIEVVPRRALEKAGVAGIEPGRCLVLELFECGADVVAQLLEPRPRSRLALFVF